MLEAGALAIDEHPAWHARPAKLSFACIGRLLGRKVHLFLRMGRGIVLDVGVRDLALIDLLALLLLELWELLGKRRSIGWSTRRRSTDLLGIECDQQLSAQFF